MESGSAAISAISLKTLGVQNPISSHDIVLGT